MQYEGAAMNLLQQIDELQHLRREAFAKGDRHSHASQQEELCYMLFSGWFEDEAVEHALRDALIDELGDGMTQRTEEWIRHQIESLGKVIEHGQKEEA